MKNYLIVLLGIFIISCQAKPVKTTGTKQKTSLKGSIIYYKADYTKDIDTILSSDSEYGKRENEIWGINKLEIKKSNQLNINDFDYNKAISLARQYLKKRFNPIELLFQSIELEHLNSGNPQQLNYIIITFSYDKKEYVQKVPMLLDGRIVLSNNE